MTFKINLHVLIQHPLTALNLRISPILKQVGKLVPTEESIFSGIIANPWDRLRNEPGPLASGTLKDEPGWF